jgi:hypothetical protein
LSDLRNALGGAASGNAITQAEAQLRGLALLQKRVDHASPASLAAIRAEVAASVAATQSFVQQMQGTGSAVTAEKAALQQASNAARGSVTDFIHDYYDQKKFDRYLQFASVEDEQEFRRREEERKRAIDKALAEHTPEGNLQANKLAIDQLKDAGAHGADRSPDYQPTLDRLGHANHDLSKAINGAQNQTVVKSAAASLDPDAAQTPPAAISPEVIARLRCAQVSAASAPSDSCSPAGPAGATGAARGR